jgi:hypothetical protein
MFGIIRAAAMAVLVTIVCPQNGATQDVSYAAIGDAGGGVVKVPADTDGSQANAPRAVPAPNEDVLRLRRTAYYYSWRGGCYTQDRNHNWYQVDPRLC